MKVPTFSQQQIQNIVVLVCLVLFVVIAAANVFGPDRVAGWIEWGLGQVAPDAPAKGDAP